MGKTIYEVCEELRQAPKVECLPTCPKHSVYLIQNTRSKHIKIGWTRGDPEKRRRDLQTASPHRLIVLMSFHGSQLEERGMHRHFAADRVHGEWFRPSRHLLDFLKMRLAANERDNSSG